MILLFILVQLVSSFYRQWTRLNLLNILLPLAALKIASSMKMHAYFIWCGDTVQLSSIMTRVMKNTMLRGSVTISPFNPIRFFCLFVLFLFMYNTRSLCYLKNIDMYNCNPKTKTSEFKNHISQCCAPFLKTIKDSVLWRKGTSTSIRDIIHYMSIRAHFNQVVQIFCCNTFVFTQ